MKCRRLRCSTTSRFAGVRDATSLEDAVRAAKGINGRVRRERYFASAVAREAYLRGLMGLPAVRSLVDDVLEGDA
jgi:hypothetical protein